MARLTLDELTTPLTRQQVEASIYSVLARLGVPTTSWKPGAVVRTMIVGVSAVFAAYSELMALIARSGFLELSSGDWLTLVAQYVYGVERLDATFASGTVLVSNSTTGSFYGFEPGDLIVKNTVTGATYRNIATFNLPANTTDLPVSVVASEPGAASSAQANTVTSVVTALPGLSVDNDVAFFGTDEETDAQLRARCSEKLGALSPMGPWDAYTSALRNATDGNGRNLGITRVSLLPDGYGHIDVYCATATGTLPDADVPFAEEAIQQWAVPQGITATVHPAVTVVLDVAADVYVYNTSGQTDEQIKAAIITSVDTFVFAQPVGGNVHGPGVTPPNGMVYRDALSAAISRTLPDGLIFHVAISTPTADVSMTPLQVLVVGSTSGIVVHQVSPQEGFHP